MAPRLTRPAKARYRRATGLALGVVALAGSGAALASPSAFGPSLVAGTVGADVLTDTPGPNLVRAYAGNDRVRASGGPDVVLAGRGNDRVFGGAGNDLLDGGPGADRLRGGRGIDNLVGGSGPDDLDGGPGYDRLVGGPGDDRIRDKSQGSQKVDGGPGDDVIDMRSRGMDVIRCGPGMDEVRADARDIVAGDCEQVTRARNPSGLVLVRSLSGRPIGQSESFFGIPEEGGQLATPVFVALLGASDGRLWFGARYSNGNACFFDVSPAIGSGQCNATRGRKGFMFPRPVSGGGLRWFVFVPTRFSSLRVGDRTYKVRKGMAAFTGARSPGPVVALAGAERLRLKVPKVGARHGPKSPG